MLIWFCRNASNVKMLKHFLAYKVIIRMIDQGVGKDACIYSLCYYLLCRRNIVGRLAIIN